MSIKIFSVIADFWLYKIPFAVIFVSLINIGLSIISAYNSQDSIKDLYITYISLVALTGGLSGVMFGYASAMNDVQKREEIIKIGEAFLYTTINYIIVLLLTWFAVSIKDSERIMASYLSQGTLALSYTYVVYAAVSFYYSITKTFRLIEPNYYKVFD